MPYWRYTTYRKGKKKWCTRNKRTSEEVCYDSEQDREKGIRLREAASKLRRGFV
jgi:hypothetical protein